MFCANFRRCIIFPFLMDSCTYLDIDLCGFRRPRSYCHDILFDNEDKLSLFVYSPVPSFEGNGNSPWGWDDFKSSWTWPGHEGKNMKVVAYSACDSVQLIFNNKLIGKK